MKIKFRCKEKEFTAIYNRNTMKLIKHIVNINDSNSYSKLLEVLNAGFYTRELEVIIEDKTFKPTFYPSKVYVKTILSTNFREEHSIQMLSIYLLEFLCLNDILKESECNTVAFNFIRDTASIEEMTALDLLDNDVKIYTELIIDEEKVILEKAITEFTPGKFTMLFNCSIQLFEKILKEIEKENYEIFSNNNLRNILKAYTIDKFVYDPINGIATITAER